MILREKRHLKHRTGHVMGGFWLLTLTESWRRYLKGEKLGIIDTGFADGCNNDHGFMLDGKWLNIVITIQQSSPGGNSRIYIAGSWWCASINNA